MYARVYVFGSYLFSASGAAINKNGWNENKTNKIIELAYDFHRQTWIFFAYYIHKMRHTCKISIQCAQK